MDTEDAVQEAVFGILRAIDRYRGIGEPGLAAACSFRSFLRRVLGDQFKDHVKRLWRIDGRHDRSPRANRVLSGHEGERDGATSCVLTRGEEDSAEVAARKELSAVRAPDHRDARSRYGQLGEGLLAGKKLREIAVEMGISYDNAKRRRRKLRASLVPFDLGKFRLRYLKPHGPFLPGEPSTR